MATHSSILPWRIPWTVWKGKNVWHWKMSPSGQKGSSMLLGKSWEQFTNSSRKNEEVGPKLKWCSVVDVSGGESKVWCCKEQYCIGAWKVRYMNQGKVDMVKQEMARVNIDVLGISELKWVRTSSVHLLSNIQLFETPWTAAHQALLSFTNSQSLLKLMSIESVMPSNHLILCHPLLPHSIFPSIRVFSNESVLHLKWPNYWSFSFSINPSNEYSGLISFRMDWLDLLAVQGTLKSLLQHHSLEALVLQCSAFLYGPTKTIALTIWTFVGKVMSMLFSMLSRFVIAFLPRSKHLLILWLQSPSAIILEPKKMKSDTVSTFSSSIWHEVLRPDAMILVSWMLSFKPDFPLSSFTFIKRLFSSSLLSAILGEFNSDDHWIYYYGQKFLRRME